MLKMAEIKNIEQCRSDFPILNRELNGKPMAFLDTAASAQKPEVVIDAMCDMMRSYYANVHRGLHSLSQESSEAYESVRAKVASFINSEENEVVFTRSTTGAINLVAYSYGSNFLKAGDEILITHMEHHANIVPWQLLKERLDIELKIIPVLDDGSLDMEAYKKLLSSKTKMVSVVHVSNVLGTINDVKQITKIAKEYSDEIKVLVDGSQSVVHGKVDVKDIGCDFFVFTGHKLYGPTGCGVLWGKYNVLDTMPPFEGGGDMVDKVTLEKSTFKSPPFRFEAGTPAIVEVVGLGAAIEYVSSVGHELIVEHEEALMNYGTKMLQEVEGIKIYGTSKHKTGVISFVADWGHCSDIGMILNEAGVAVRTGRHCCEPIMDRFDIQGTVRASFGLYSNKDDIDALISGLKTAKRLLG
jgi:cysteine desulfurase/selenocysteine lyase